MNAYALVTLGCKVNAYESAALGTLFSARGYHPVHEGEAPDVVIINTCAVTATSDQKSRQHIRSWIARYPDAVVVAMGCYTQMAHALLMDIPGLAIVVGTSRRHEIPDLIATYRMTGLPIDAVIESPRTFAYESLGVTSYSDHTRAYLKIQDGCDHFCSYCVIPLVRGKMRSRPAAEILAEARALVDKGYREIVLTGIHTAGYGSDLGNYRFHHLVADLLKALPELDRLRISSIEIAEIDDGFLRLLKAEPRLARHLHIPLQSGSASVLRRMNRPYDTSAFLAIVAKVREAVPDIALTTDVIVGFPGESEAEFAETEAFIQRVHFAQLHVFPFSARSGTAAFRMKDAVDPATKKARVHRLMALSDQLWDAYRATFSGRLLPVLIEDRDPRTGRWRGHASNYLEGTLESAEDLHGKMVDIRF